MSNLKNITAILTIFVVSVVHTPSVHAKPAIYGWLEYAYLKPWGVVVKAKLDTGAKTSSIHAVDIEPFDKDGEKWVRFTLGSPIGEKEGFEEGIVVEKPIVRKVKIKEHVGKFRERYVVELRICLAGKTYKTQVSVVDRSKFNYELLLGRRTLADKMIVDPSKIFTVKKACKVKKRSPAKQQDQ